MKIACFIEYHTCISNINKDSQRKEHAGEIEKDKKGDRTEIKKIGKSRSLIDKKLS